MATVLFGSANIDLLEVSGLAKVTDQTKFPFETTWCTADGFYITAFGNNLGLDATGTYFGTAEDIRISDSSGTLLLVLRGVNVSLFPLTSGFQTSSFLAGDDSIIGTDNGETIYGLSGDDVVDARGGDDIVFGGLGNDILGGNGGNDQLHGDDGNDTLNGGAGDDSLWGDEGCDTINGDDGNDVADGGGGDDVIHGGYGNDHLGGNGGNDIVFGDGGNDTVVGGAGNDDLYGGYGNDRLMGDDGVDFITGGLGRDILTGGACTDYFNYDSLAEVGKAASRDLITDFTHGVDKIGLADIDANTKVSGNQAFAFGGYGAAFDGRCGLLKYYFVNPAGTAYDRTIVQGDLNGDKIADFQIELTGLKALSAADFIL